MKERIYLSPPHQTGSEIDFIETVFESNWIAPVGPDINAFEEELQDYLGPSSYVTCLSSGTASIHLALIMCEVGKGDIVLCQSLTFSASANPILYQGAIPAFVDSEADSWNMCPDLLDESIKSHLKQGIKPKAIIVTHSYGMPAKMTEILRLANHYDIPLIEDAAGALGSSYRGQKCGTLGSFGIISFNGNKIVTTSGGGALISSEQQLKAKAIYLATQARDHTLHYQHSTVGYNYRLSNVLASIGRAQLTSLEDRLAIKRENHEFYDAFFKEHPGVYLFKERNPDIISNHWLNCILIDQEVVGCSTTELQMALEEANIESRPLWKPLHLQPIFKKYDFFGPGISSELFQKGLCLPSGTSLTKENKSRILEVLNRRLA